MEKVLTRNLQGKRIEVKITEGWSKRAEPSWVRPFLRLAGAGHEKGHDRMP